MRTTAKDFEKFKKSFEKYKEKLGVRNVEIIFEHTLLKSNDAEIAYYFDDVSAVVGLSTETNRSDMDFLAKHEAAELFLAELRCLAEMRYVQANSIEAGFHKAV